MMLQGSDLLKTRRPYRALTCLLCLILLSPAFTAQKTNRLNNSGERTGKWRVYSDTGKTDLVFSGRFRNGRPVGKALYYRDGVLLKQERYIFSRIKISTFHPNGNKESKGFARIEEKTDTIHYYFYGKWRYYDTLAQPLKQSFFEKGKITATKFNHPQTRWNDSLMKALNGLEETFLKKNSELLDTISRARYNPLKREALTEILFIQDSVSFLRVSSLLSKHGYPRRGQLGEAADIPLFILSHAPWSFREKHLPFIEAAVEEGTISKISFANFVDKLLLDSGKKQLYGTQKYFDANKGFLPFEVSDPENLSQRRQQMGLTE